MTLAAHFDTEEGQRGYACQTGVSPEKFEVAEDVVQADAPGDRRQRQVVAFHAQRDESEKERNHRRQRDAYWQVNPRRYRGMIE